MHLLFLQNIIALRTGVFTFIMASNIWRISRLFAASIMNNITAICTTHQSWHTVCWYSNLLSLFNSLLFCFNLDIISPDYVINVSQVVGLLPHMWSNGMRLPCEIPSILFLFIHDLQLQQAQVLNALCWIPCFFRTSLYQCCGTNDS